VRVRETQEEVERGRGKEGEEGMRKREENREKREGWDEKRRRRFEGQREKDEV
jgi:hypothetical protein